MKIFVGGVFNDEGGRESGYVKKLTTSLKFYFPELLVVNGGNYSFLESLLKKVESDVDTLFWFCDVPNDKPKLVNGIFKINPNLNLIISKNNRQNKYTNKDLQERMLSANATYLLEFKDAFTGIGATLHKKNNKIIFQDEVEINKVAQSLGDIL